MAFDLRRRRRPANVARGNAYAQAELEGRLFAPRGLCLLQNDLSIANASGATVRSDLNSALQSLGTLSSGATAPSTTYAYMLWADTTTSTLKRRNAANSAWIIVRTLDEAFVVARSSNTILDESDIGKTIVATSTFTQTLTAAATLADGWWVRIRNDGTGVITIDPNSSELIDGATTLVLNPGEAALIVCNGSAFKTHGLGLVRGNAGLLDNFTFALSVGSNALTIALKTRNGNDPTPANPVRVPFRNATVATGDFTDLPVTAASSLVVSSGSTLGTVNSTAFRLWIVGFNDGGTFRLGVINCRSGTSIYPLAPWGIASSTTEGGAGAADSAQVFYSGTGVTAKAYAVLGYVTYESGLATAGTWSAVPTRAQLYAPGVPLPGTSVQLQRTVDGTVVTGSTVIPQDNTTPQNTEGAQYLAQAVTPSSAANLLMVDVLAYLTATADVAIIGALFQDSTASALASAWSYSVGAAPVIALALRHAMLAGTTSATTLKFRAGGSAAANVNMNADSAAGALFNATLASHIQVTEIMA